MKRAMIFAATLILAVSVTGRAEDKPDPRDMEIRALRAEVAMLKKQVASLKEKLAAAPKPKPTTQPAPDEPTATIQKGDPKWWRDAGAFASACQKAASRGSVSVALWLGRHNWFNGQEVNWTVNRAQAKVFSTAEAGKEYYRLLDNLDKRGWASQLQANRIRLQWLKKMMDGGGGAILDATASENFRVYLPVYGDRREKAGLVSDHAIEITGHIAVVSVKLSRGQYKFSVYCDGRYKVMPKAAHKKTPATHP